MIIISPLSSERRSDYYLFLLTDEKTLIYSSPDYAEYLTSSVGGECACLLALENGAIVGSISYFRKTHPELGTIINSLPWYGSHGGCVLADDTRDDVRKALLAAYMQDVAATDTLTATMILTPFEEKSKSVYESVIKPNFIDGRIGQITELVENGPDVDNRLLAILSQKTRNLVRKSLKQGFSFHETDDEESWSFLFKTHQENIAAIGGKAKPLEHFQAMRSTIPPEMRRLFVATDGDKPVAAVLLLYFNKTVEYITPVILHDYRSRQPLSFLIYNAMLDAIGRGFRWWNWGGTWKTQESLYHFKAGWGAVDMPYSYLINASEKAVSTLKERREEIVSAFPYYYVFPFDLL